MNGFGFQFNVIDSTPTEQRVSTENQIIHMKKTTFLRVLILSTASLFTQNSNAQDYCDAGSSDCRNEIELVDVVGESSRINKATGCNGYSDFTSDFIYAVPGQTYDGAISCNPTGFFAGQVTVWIDWNDNGLFTDIGEQVFNTSTSTAGEGSFPFVINVASDQPLGNLRMRIKTESTAGSYEFVEMQILVK